MYKTQRYKFNPEKYEETIVNLLEEIANEKSWNKDSLRRIQVKHPKDKKFMFSKNDLLRGYNYLVEKKMLNQNKNLVQRIKMKPVRTQSGVAPVTVLTKPWGCPGNCIYCPTEPNMPKSYIERANREPKERLRCISTPTYRYKEGFKPWKISAITQKK